MKFILRDLDQPRPYAVLDHLITDHEVLEIKDWCRKNDCTYYSIGVVKFCNHQTTAMFVLKWS